MILRNLIYILQSENYYLGRFLKFAYTHLVWWKFERRQKIVWTPKARALQIMSVLLIGIVVGFFFDLFKLPGLFIMPVLLLLMPFIIGASLLILLPLDTILKQRKITVATRIILESKVKVIGIAGSYGKTSAKEILAAVLAVKFSVVKTPENVNTDVGIAEFVIKNQNEFQEGRIFIVEMGAYRKGEIKKICKMVCPAYSILTGINEAHLEKFGSLPNIIEAKFELPQNTKDLAVLNFDDNNIRENYSKFKIGKAKGISRESAKNITAKKDFKGLEFEWEGLKFETKLLAEHNVTLILLCAKIAQELSMLPENIRRGVANVKPISHRLQPIYNATTGIMVLDDSYNGNFNGIESGIHLLGQASGRKIVLTPGLVELGPKMEEVHAKIGELYAKRVDLVLLIENQMTKHILEGLKKNKFKNYKIYENTEAAHADLKNVLQKGDTIIFQNDLTDNYF
jgi:UDP-N-acetylmuramoyl-tripeptide--D-alanyl-D-alanine ligase